MTTTTKVRKINYPTSDGKPMAETEVHFEVMKDTRESLKWYYADQPMVHVSGNLIVCYVEGDRRKHVAPDVFVVFGVPKRLRDNYLVWEEGKAPDVIFEATSKSTRRQDTTTKFVLYRDVFKTREYFLFDPYEEYLNPPLQGYRLVNGEYERIEPVNGRLPSEVLGLHVERDGPNLRLRDPKTGRWVPTPNERAAEAEDKAAEAKEEAAQAKEEATQAKDRAEQAEAELKRLRQEIDDLRRRATDGAN